MSRHDLRACPVFHHTRDATWAHLTVVMASLAVARYLQDATGTKNPGTETKIRKANRLRRNLHLANHLVIPGRAATQRCSSPATNSLNEIEAPQHPTYNRHFASTVRASAR